MVFCLLPKRTHTVVRVFQYLMSEFQKYEIHLSPNNVYVDFEVAIQKAINIVLPHSNVKGCRFHLGQNMCVF